MAHSAFSGAAAGFAGGLWLTGGVPGDRFTAGISSNLGWQGLLVALLARQRAAAGDPDGVRLRLRCAPGPASSPATGVDRRIADVVQAMLVLALLVAARAAADPRRRAERRAVAA